MKIAPIDSLKTLFSMGILAAFASSYVNAGPYNLGAFWRRPVAAANVSTVAVPIVGGTYTFCEILADNTVACWGENTSGQYGNNSTVSALVPTSTSGISTAVAVALADYAGCVLLADKTIKCWGNGNVVGPSGYTLTPVAFPGLSNVAQISMAGYEACAVLTDGTGRCWGQGGTNGDGTTSGSNTAVTVSGLSGATSIAVGFTHNCAVLASGGVKCWGVNNDGEVGDGTTTRRNSPVSTPVTGAIAVAVGNTHSCALLGTGSVQCWGRGTGGQLGDGLATSSSTPVTVTGISNATALFSSPRGDTTCVILATGALSCWGDGSSSQMGQTLAFPYYASTPISIPNVTSVTYVAMSFGTTCALLADGSTRCWGNGYQGAIGNGISPYYDLPNAVTSSDTFASLANGFQYTLCGILTDATAKCWGTNAVSQVGDGTATDRSSPTTVGLNASFKSISSHQNNSCAVLSDGTPYCWGLGIYNVIGNGSNSSQSSPTLVSSITNATAVSVAAYHACALLSTGALKCWGRNAYGELGDNTTTARMSPVSVLGISTAISVAAGTDYTCALLSTGGVKCWGSNGSYPGNFLGDGTNTTRPSPVSVIGVSSATALSSGEDGSCALIAGGTVKCWGGYLYGTSTVTVSLTNATQVSTNGGIGCAVIRDGSVKCWGNNAYGALGNGTYTDAPITSPVLVSGITDAIAVSVGGGAGSNQLACALLATGKVRCWGSASPLFQSTGEGKGSSQVTATSQVYGTDRITVSPLTSISGTSPIPADGVTTSSISIRLTDPSGSALVGVVPTFSVTNSDAANVVTACTSSDGSGNSTCTVKSSYPEVKDLTLLTPVLTRGAPSKTITFTGTGPTQYLVSGPSSIPQGECSSPFQVRTADANARSATVPSPVTATLSGLGSAQLFSDPLCTQSISNSFPIAAGASSYNFYVKDTVGETLFLQAAGATYTTGASLVVTIIVNYSTTFSSITGTSSITADGSSTSTVTITLKDTSNTAVAGVTPTFSASGTGNSYGACSASNASGVSTCTMTSTKAETKTLSLVTPVALTGGTVTFVPGANAKLGYRVSPGASVPLATTWTTQPSVEVQDTNGNATGSGTPTVTISAYSNAGCTLAAGGILSSSGTGLSMAATGGIADFTGVAYEGSLAPFYLKAAATGLTDACYGPISAQAFFAAASGNNTSGGTSVTLNAPAGIVAGHMLIAGVSARVSGTTITAPAGWTQIVNHGTTTNLRQTSFWKLATGAEPANYSFTLSASVRASGVIAAYSGIHQTTPINTSGGNANAASTSIVAPSVTPTQTSTVFVGVFGNAHGNGVSSTPPTGFTYRLKDASSVATVSNGCGTMIADKALTSTAATGTATATSTNSVQNVGQSISLSLQCSGMCM